VFFLFLFFFFYISYELVCSGVATARSNILMATAIMQAGQPLVQAEAIACLQQLHMFAPRQLDLPALVPQLVRLLSSPHLALRRAAIACLRQLVQRESKEVRK
jgi:HEAT repeat-containing protein 5